MSAALKPAPIAWQPQVGPQSDACACAAFVDELFYGGAVFGGKSDFLLGDFASDIDQGGAWTGILFRRSGPELEDIIERSQEIYPYLGAHWMEAKKTWRFATGAVLRLRHMENVADFQKYMGHSYSWIGFDELPNWPTLNPYHRMKTRLRGSAQHKRIRATGNPGGVCHNEIKQYFKIGEHRAGNTLYIDPKSHQSRMFIPARVEDNVIGLSTDPGYLDRLEGLNDPELVKALKEGDWDAIVGAYFSMFSAERATVDPFEIPDGWSVFSGGDYGEENPTWWGLVAVDFDNDLWVIDEYYRAGAGGADHARGVKAMIDNCPYIRRSRPQLNLAPHDMWTKRRPGEAAQALAPQDSFAAEGVHLTRANMNRVNGWRNLKDLAYADRIHFFRGRTEHIISSLATVQRDPHDAEDVLKAGDDHPADGLRYIINHVYKPRLLKKTDTRPNAGAAVIDVLESLGKQKSRYS